MSTQGKLKYITDTLGVMEDSGGQMNNQDKYNYIIKKYKSLDGVMIMIDNKNIYSLYRKYQDTIRHCTILTHKDGSKTIYPEFTNDLILLTSLIYNEIIKMKNSYVNTN
jgi:hypothetical protein